MAAWFRGVSVPGPMFIPGGSLYRGVSVQGGLCPGGSLSRGVSVQGVSIRGSLCRGGLPDRPPRDPLYGLEGAVRILLECFLVFVKF